MAIANAATMIKTVLVDDEPQSLEGLHSLLNLFVPKVEIVATAQNFESANEVIRNNNPELVFMDIELGDGNSIDLLSRFTNRDFAVVFVTAYDHYAVDALRFKADDYLMKPVTPNQLKEAVNRVQANFRPAVKQEHIRFSVPTQSGFRVLNSAEIVRLSSDNNYTLITLAEGKQILVTKTLKTFVEAMPNELFIRVHRGHLINLDYIEEYMKSEGGWVIMQNGDEVPVSRSQKAWVESLFSGQFLSL